MYLLNIGMKLDLTKQYIDLETVNKFIEYNSDFSNIIPIPEPHFDVVFMSYYEADADKHYELLKKRVPTAKRVNGVKGILNAYNACRKIAKTPYYFIVEGDSMICRDFSFKPTKKWITDIANLRKEEFNYEYVQLRKQIRWHSLNPVNGEIWPHSPISLVYKTIDKYNQFKESVLPINYEYLDIVNDTKLIIEDNWRERVSLLEPTIASIDGFNSSPYDAWKTGFRIGNRITTNLLNDKDKPTTNENSNRLDRWTTIGYEQKNGKYCIEGVTYGIKCARISSNWIEEYRNTTDNYKWLKETFEREYGTQYNTDRVSKETVTNSSD